MRKAWILHKEDKKDYFRFLNQEDGFPSNIEKLLMEASLLYHVPFHYLVPDMSMLPAETIQFFSVDYNWVLSYMDGICSVGRNAGIDYTHDTELLIKIYQKALRGNGQIRKELQHLEEKSDSLQDGDEEAASGFFLHSVLVEDFRGIEIRAYADKDGKRQLRPLRIEKLGTQLLLGIFQGKIRRVEFVQPPEGLHYGLVHTHGCCYKMLRSVETGEVGEQQLTIAMREGDDRTLNVEKMAGDMGKQLKRNITAADIGLQMIQNAHTAVFIVGGADEYH